MTMEQGKYNIKAVTQLTGVQAGTLRAWERRYDIVRPVRNELGHRLYTDEHVRKIKWLVQKIENGFTISQAISLLKKDVITHEENPFRLLKEQLYEALITFEEQQVKIILDQVLSMYTIERVVTQLLLPLLQKIVEEEEKRTIVEAQKTVASTIVLMKIQQLFQMYPVNLSLPKGIIVGSKNIQSEVERLLFVFYLKKRGYNVVHFEAACKEEELEGILTSTNGKFIIFSFVDEKEVERATQLICHFIEDHRYSIGVSHQTYQSLVPIQQKSFKSSVIKTNEESIDKWIINVLKEKTRNNKAIFE